jgi:hypothetical protein
VAHRWYRAEGFQVRTPADLLERATGDFLEWRGVKKKDEPVDPATPKAAPRIEVTVERTQRRQTIPQQPDRAVAARTPAQPTPPVSEADRSAIVQEMLRRRNLPRGRVGLA